MLEPQPAVERRITFEDDERLAPRVGRGSDRGEGRSDASTMEIGPHREGREAGDSPLPGAVDQRDLADHHVADDRAVDLRDERELGTKPGDLRIASTSSASAREPNAAATMLAISAASSPVSGRMFTSAF